MAALRPEPEESLDDQCNNSDFLEEKREEVEGEGTAGEAPESREDLFQENAEAKEPKECAQALSSSSAHCGFVRNGESNPSRECDSAAPQGRTVSPEEDVGLAWSESEEELGSRTCSFSGHEQHQGTPEHQTTEDLGLDTGSTIGHEDPLAQDEEEELTDLSVEMECDGDSKEGEEEKGEEMSEEEEEEEEPKGEVQSKEPEEGEDRGTGDDEECHEVADVDKQRKNRLSCRDCGKSFTRRETYDLHRHFHMHQDEQASLTCKECGLTFQHRSSLIKHRSEHKQNGVPDSTLVSYKRSQLREFREEKIFECEHCGDCFTSLIRYKLHACQQSLEKPYRCPLCRKEFQYRVSINAHMQSHSLECPYRCLECNKGFQCAVTLHIHQRSHAALKPYECPDCGMVFRHRSFMEDHRRKHTEERPHRCTICGKNFKYSSLLQQHQYLHTGQKPYRCTECGKRFAFAQNMRAHCRQHKKLPSSIGFEAAVPENKEMPNGTGLGSVGKENTNTNIEHQRNCPLCPQLFDKAADLRAHILTHEAEYENLSNGKKNYKVYSCPNCPLQFLDESTFQSHVLTHQVIATPMKREVLSVASSASADNISADGECGDQTEKKPLRCRDCGKSFRYRSVLELHMRIHNRGYQCHVCKKSFRFSSYLQQHLIIHSGKKPYKCPDCGKDFAFLQNMKTHQRLHQQKPFRCTQCRKGYSDESQLQRHMLCHSGDKPHKCNICNKSFGLAYLLRDHLNTHTGERPHRCQECHKSFPWLSSLLVHQKIHARKRQGAGQSYTSTIGSQRGRTSAVGRGRKSGKWVSGWPRMGGNVDRAMPLQQATFNDQSLQGSVSNLLGQESNVFDSDRNEQTQVMPIQLQQQWQIQIHSQLQQSKWLSEGHSNNFRHQWQSATHLKPILPKPDGLPKLVSQQQSPGWAEVTPSSQAGPAPKQLPENCTAQNNCDTASTSTSSPTRGCTDGPSKSEAKVQQQPPSWRNSPSSTPKSPGTADGSLSVDAKTCSSVSNTQNSPNIQGQQSSQWPVSDLAQNTNMGLGSSGNVITFSLKTPADTQQVDTESDKPEQPQLQQSSTLASATSSTQTRQNTDVVDDCAALKNDSKPLNIVTPLETSKSVNSQEKPVTETSAQQPQLHIMPPPSKQQHQQLQLVLQPPQQIQLLQQPVPQMQPEQLQLIQQQQFHQPQTNPLGSVSVQFGTTPFTHGNGNAVFGFQTTSVVSQALLNGPVQQQQGPQQQAPSQILLNQASPFITSPLPLAPPLALPGPHPIHSIAGQLPGPAPQNIFFSPPGIMNERPVMPQALPSTHVGQRTEPNKLISQISFATDHRFRCMICGCTLPGELELQVHYMQHVQGEV
ncbi:zinc finger protein 62 homolog isoform X2 [Neoarius graeffei]|uniref:zinc finger protein 62 homolog isoform X2 n=1 Tax=Neoarius graeffei TaxID=443677 RepID=UPI00298CA161|nr:zinc finger protein 62 homolog isoform X2 [Neoarius graeffei]